MRCVESGKQDNRQDKEAAMPGRNIEDVTRTPPLQPPEGDRKTVEQKLKRQTGQRKPHEKPDVHADRPRDRQLKPERKGVI